MQKSSQLSGFYKYALTQRTNIIANWANLTSAEISTLENALSAELGNAMIENVIGLYNLPLGIATNFQINDADILVPMVVEEPSIVAGVSFAAKLARAGGGFLTRSSEPIMIGQVQVLDVPNMTRAVEAIQSVEKDLLTAANQHHPTIQKLGGGAKSIETRVLKNTAVGAMLIVHILYDCRDAMGANAVNTAAESIAPLIEDLTGGRVNLRILSNLTDRRTATAECRIPAELLSTKDTDGKAVARAIVEAWAFAAADPYRAATHNKGVMNGIDAVAIATGNDWRAIEAGAHAFAVKDGRYTSMTNWRQDDAGDLHGKLHIPLSVGTVGGATKVHPTARTAMKILGNPGARRLSEVMAAVGLAQNLAAIRALATEGIQHGHMRLHARQVALSAGATGAQAQAIANQLIAEGNIRTARAREILSNNE